MATCVTEYGLSRDDAETLTMRVAKAGRHLGDLRADRFWIDALQTGVGPRCDQKGEGWREEIQDAHDAGDGNG